MSILSQERTQPTITIRWQVILFALFAVIFTVTVTQLTVQRPDYTDAFYYYNAAERLASGEGLTTTYLWVYTGAPEAISPDGTFPSHLYWMPLTSLVAAVGLWLGGGSYAAAQVPLALMWAGAAGVGYWLGGRLGGTNRHRWVAGALVLFSGFFVRLWGMTDSFAPYAFVGALALVFLGLSSTDERPRWWVPLLAGVFAGFGHLARADGLLLLLVGWLVIGWRYRLRGWRTLLLLTAGYLLVMTPWFIRNLNTIGTPLAVGGAQAVWYTSYSDLFNYPPGVGPAAFFSDGVGILFSSRWRAFTNNLGTFVAVEGLIILTPLMLIGLWNRRRQPFLVPFWVYALGLHAAMTLVFPFPGYRGGLFHSAAALVPWWAALSVVGLDDTIDWIAQRRPNWRPKPAKRIFSTGLVLLALVLTWMLTVGNTARTGTPGLYIRMAETLPPDARVMVNDPTVIYYFTGLGGAAIPNAAPEVIPELAERYELTHLMVEFSGGQPALPGRFTLDINDPPDFLTPIELPGARLYEIRRDP